MTSGVSRVAKSHSFRPYRSFGATVLEPIVKPLSNTLFSKELWSFKQDLVPAYKANSTMDWVPDSG